LLPVFWVSGATTWLATRLSRAGVTGPTDQRIRMLGMLPFGGVSLIGG
jgi:hypothetical protein